ncbi:MAG TPA: porin [Kofleriaceae bacterium]|nr:porin [Kofleriaceae bacterium]
MFRTPRPNHAGMVQRSPALAGAAALALACALSPPALADSQFNLYGDIDAGLTTTGTRAGTADGFSAATLDLFTTTTVDRWQFLAEVLFEAGDENAFNLDVERIEVGYLFRNWLRVRVGRFHTAIGYYNDAFHHGAYFMLPVGRPTAVEFEDGGGLIPAHTVGLHADGRLPAGDGHLRYDLELANGRGAEPDAIQNEHDTNRPKAFNVRLRYEPGGTLDGLVVGGNLYFDSIPAFAGPTPHGALHEWIVGAHAAYFEHEIHAVAEAMMIQHSELGTDAHHRTYAVFAEVGHSLDKLTPYARYQWTQFPDEGDAFYARTADDGYQAVSLGVKHATSDNIALKAEAGVTFSQAPGADPLFSVTGQVAFAF